MHINMYTKSGVDEVPDLYASICSFLDETVKQAEVLIGLTGIESAKTDEFDVRQRLTCLHNGLAEIYRPAKQLADWCNEVIKE